MKDLARRLIPILLSGSPLGSANMHSKRTFRLVCCPLVQPAACEYANAIREAMNYPFFYSLGSRAFTRHEILSEKTSGCLKVRVWGDELLNDLKCARVERWRRAKLLAIRNGPYTPFHWNDRPLPYLLCLLTSHS